MNPRRIAEVLLFFAVIGGSDAFAQTLPSRVFVDGAFSSDRDPTDYFDGSPVGTAGRGAVGFQFSTHSSVRFELDVPRWRVTDTAGIGQVWCAGGEGFVRAALTSRTAVRTVSSSFLYARHLPALGPVHVALLAGGSIENRDRKSSGSFDELSRDGRVVRHNAYSDERSLNWVAGVVGVDAEMKLTSHLAVTPQFRFHTFPYPAVSIIRPGIALRWRF